LKSETELAPEIFQKIIDSISGKKIVESTKEEQIQNIGSLLDGNKLENGNRNNRFSTRKDFLSKPP
jgi:hypothetical protein